MVGERGNEMEFFFGGILGIAAVMIPTVVVTLMMRGR